MFLIDKYKNDSIMPSYDILTNLLNSLDLHTNIYNNINNIVSLPKNEFHKIIDNMEHGEWHYANLPHLILYGPEGCGKEFLLETLLQKIFTKKSVELQEVEYIINGYSNTKTKVLIKQSKHHIVLEPNNNGFDNIVRDNYYIVRIVNYKNNNLFFENEILLDSLVDFNTSNITNDVTISINATLIDNNTIVYSFYSI
jgi:Cdc6-like AAA superfamily ATPase